MSWGTRHRWHFCIVQACSLLQSVANIYGVPVTWSRLPNWWTGHWPNTSEWGQCSSYTVPTGAKTVVKNKALGHTYTQPRLKETTEMLKKWKNNLANEGGGTHGLSTLGLMREQDNGVYNSKVGNTWQEHWRTTTRQFKSKLNSGYKHKT